MFRYALSLLFISITICTFSSKVVCQAQRVNQEDYKIDMLKTTEEVIIDGVLNEEIWTKSDVATDFWMSEPIDGEKVPDEYDTEAMITYDDQFIYVGAKCHSPDPVLMTTLKRDNGDIWSGDVFYVNIDPLNETTNGFVFVTNTAGVQFEALLGGGSFVRGGGGGGGNFTQAWDQTWFSEAKVYDNYWTVEIAIPFKSLRYADKGEWGINFSRGLSSQNQFHSWVPIPVQFMTIDLGHTGALIWDDVPENSKSNISVIPYVLASTNRNIEDAEDAVNNLRVGGDAKIAITPSLNLDLTINPDFSQVDVDEQVTNLTTVNIRFPERRLFFLENSDIFSEIGIPPIRPFFSRRIGLDANGGALPITYCARLSGNVNKDLRIGVMNLQTRETEEFSGQNYTSLSVNQQVFGRSQFKGYFHNRQNTTDDNDPLNDYNRVGGFEYTYLSNDSKWRGIAGFGLSWSPELTNDNYLYNVAIGRDTRTFSFYTNVAGVGNNYRSDVGFIPRLDHFDAALDTTVQIGFHHGFTTASYRLFPEISATINSHVFNVRNILDYTKDGLDLIQNRTIVSYELNMNNTSGVFFNFNHERQGLIRPFTFTENPLPVGRYNFNYAEIGYDSDVRKNFNYGLSYLNGGFYNGNRTQYVLRLSYRTQPWGNFGVNFNYNQLDLLSEFGESEFYLVSSRMEINFSRNIFWTTFLQFNTQQENFNINSRLQWRFKPLSDLFLVYTENYNTDIWGARNRGVVLKMNYWINL